ncbi:MAG: acyl-CoA dehydrogenase [Desulfatibacillaceae bacterium]
MAQSITDRRDVSFVMNEQLGIDQLCKADRYCDLNQKTFDMVMQEARNLAIKEILPTFKESDEVGCQFDNGEVKVPPSYHRAYELFREGEWLTVADDPEIGGQGMPHVLACGALELFAGANLAFSIYAMLGHGAGKIIEEYGSEEQKNLYLPKVYSGEWGGTMCLTEPEAGSDVGALTTTAKDNGDGTYSITGTKIFISAGEHDLVPNIIHPVLARIEGDPPGTPGISIFIVPKVWVNEDGSLGGTNGVTCDRIEEKMGIHGSCTCQLSFGAKEQCRGVLLGEPRKGMRIMFVMMNEERLNVGVQGLGAASTAYLYAVNYARERLQGKNLLKAADKAAPSVAIMQHPDIRRMLIEMKAYVEGLRSLNYYTGLCMDLARVGETEEVREKYRKYIDLLTPICKAYTTEKGYKVCVDAIQVYGGYGYTQEYPVEQIARDCKITTIYEGTTGIQAMDLLGRKLGMDKGQVFMSLLKDMQKTVAEGKEIPMNKAMAEKLEEGVNRLGEVAQVIGKTASSEKVMTAFANAYPFLECMGDVILGWMWLWRANTAAPKLVRIAKGEDAEAVAKAVGKNKDAAFYDGQIKTASYFINAMLPVTFGRMESIKANESSPVDMADASFGG